MVYLGENLLCHQMEFDNYMIKYLKWLLRKLAASKYVSISVEISKWIV